MPLIDFDYEKLAPNAPAAWLALSRGDYNGHREAFGYVEEISPIPFTDDFYKGRKRQLEFGWKFQFIMDDPSIPVVHWYGISIHNPASLTARKNWFIRYRDILADHLLNPLPTQAITYKPGILTDPLGSFIGKPSGPFPWPKGRELPVCPNCGKRMPSLGALGLRDLKRIAHFNAPGPCLVIHACLCCGVELAQVTDFRPSIR